MHNPEPKDQSKSNEAQSTLSLAENGMGVSVSAVAVLAVDVWKIAVRAKNERAGERVLAACERAEDRLRRMGFEILDLDGRVYDTNMHVRVVEHDGGEEPFLISQCLSPAVYYQGVLVHEAEVITKGS